VIAIDALAQAVRDGGAEAVVVDTPRASIL